MKKGGKYALSPCNSEIRNKLFWKLKSDSRNLKLKDFKGKNLVNHAEKKRRKKERETKDKKEDETNKFKYR